MNLHSSRARNNPLLRWVHRHTNVSTLFRSTLPRNTGVALPRMGEVLQHNLPSTQTPVTPANGEPRISRNKLPMFQRSPQAIPEQTTDSLQGILSDNEHQSPAMSESPEVVETKDHDWRRLRAIYRKHQSQDSQSSFEDPDHPAVEPGSGDPVPQTSPHDDKQPKFRNSVWQRLKKVLRKGEEKIESKSFDTSDTNTLETRSGENIQSSLTGEDKRSTIAVISAKGIPERLEERRSNARQEPRSIEHQTDSVPSFATPQHSTENTMHTSKAIGRRIMKDQPSPPSSFHPDETADRLPEDDSVVSHQRKLSNTPFQQSIPLQSAWNVQRIEHREDAFHEPDGKTKDFGLGRQSFAGLGDDQDEESFPLEPSAKQYILAEILPPSRPRPASANVPSSNSIIQAQTENKHGVQETSEAPMVDTAVGPLPTDLWNLLKQPPPQVKHPPEATGLSSRSFNKELEPAPQRTISDHQHKPSREQPSNISNAADVIQRQTEPEESLASQTLQTNTGVEENWEDMEPDIDDLARRVYSEIRGRLNVEWERMRRR